MTIRENAVMAVSVATGFALMLALSTQVRSDAPKPLYTSQSAAILDGGDGEDSGSADDEKDSRKDDSVQQVLAAVDLAKNWIGPELATRIQLSVSSHGKEVPGILAFAKIDSRDRLRAGTRFHSSTSNVRQVSWQQYALLYVGCALAAASDPSKPVSVRAITAPISMASVYCEAAVSAEREVVKELLQVTDLINDVIVDLLSSPDVIDTSVVRALLQASATSDNLDEYGKAVLNLLGRPNDAETLEKLMRLVAQDERAAKVRILHKMSLIRFLVALEATASLRSVEKWVNGELSAEKLDDPKRVWSLDDLSTIAECLWFAGMPDTLVATARRASNKRQIIVPLIAARVLPSIVDAAAVSLIPASGQAAGEEDLDKNYGTRVVELIERVAKEKWQWDPVYSCYRKK